MIKRVFMSFITFLAKVKMGRTLRITIAKINVFISLFLLLPSYFKCNLAIIYDRKSVLNFSVLHGQLVKQFKLFLIL